MASCTSRSSISLSGRLPRAFSCPARSSDPVGSHPGFLLSPDIEVTLRMVPPPAFFMGVAASWQRRNMEETFSPEARRKSFIGMSKGLGPPPPALFTSVVS